MRLRRPTATSLRLWRTFLQLSSDLWNARSCHCWRLIVSPTKCSRLAFGELLQAIEYALKQIRAVYSGLKWGKGLSAINHQMWELIDKVERENRFQGRPHTPDLGGCRLGRKRCARRLRLPRMHLDPFHEPHQIWSWPEGCSRLSRQAVQEGAAFSGGG